MPSQILHTLFGEDVLSGIHLLISRRFGIVADKALEKIRLPYRTAFTLGCQGPDIFYHSRDRRPVGLEYGSLLHRRGAGIFTAGLLKMGLPDPPPDEDDIKAGRREKGINALGAYALGFMTHAFLDRRAHPYIVYKSGFVSAGRPETNERARFHVFFERILDVLMLRELRGLEIDSWDQEVMLAQLCEKPPLGLRELLAKALVLAFPERAGSDGKLSLRIENTLADCAEFYRMTSPKLTSIKNPGLSIHNFPGAVSYLYPENLRDKRKDPCGVDFLNLEKLPWSYPLAGAEKDSRSFPELYADAVEAAVNSIAPLIAGYLDTGIFPITEAARAIGNGGLSIVDEYGKPCAPSLADPLPLGETLREQASMRGL